MKTVLEKGKGYGPETLGIVYGGLTTVNCIAFQEISSGTCNPAKIIGPGSALYEINLKVVLIAFGQLLGGLLGGIFFYKIDFSHHMGWGF